MEVVGGLKTDSDLLVSKDSLESSINSIKEAVEGKRRDDTIIRVCHLNILLTGGMSWGDDPTDLMGEINLLTDIDCGSILNAIGFDQDLIDYKALLEKILKVKALQPLLLGLDKTLNGMLEKEFTKCPRKQKPSSNKP